jgi:hypothetical protein
MTGRTRLSHEAIGQGNGGYATQTLMPLKRHPRPVLLLKRQDAETAQGGPRRRCTARVVFGCGETLDAV